MSNGVGCYHCGRRAPPGRGACPSTGNERRAFGAWAVWRAARERGKPQSWTARYEIITHLRAMKREDHKPWPWLAWLRSGRSGPNVHSPEELAEALALLEPARWLEKDFPGQLSEVLEGLAYAREERVFPGADRGEKSYTGLSIQGHFPDRRYRILLDGTVMVDRWLLSYAPELLEKAKAAGFQPWG